MSEETNVETNDGTWSGLKKTIIGAISTAILAGGTYLTTTLFGGGQNTVQTAGSTDLNNFVKGMGHQLWGLAL